MSVDHTQRHAAEDHRNEARLRLQTIAGLEDHARASLHARLVGALVQRQEPHAFHDATVRERVSPRRGMDVPDKPGFDDIGGFGIGVIC